jgi:hypothetical protein
LSVAIFLSRQPSKSWGVHNRVSGGNFKGLMDAIKQRENERKSKAASFSLPLITARSKLVALQLITNRSHAKPFHHVGRHAESCCRSIFALADDRDRAYFGRGNENEDQIGFLGGNERAIFGRSYAAEPEVLIEQLKKDEAIAEADTLLLTVPNQLGVDYNAHVIEAILKHVAPGLGWR